MLGRRERRPRTQSQRRRRPWRQHRLLGSTLAVACRADCPQAPLGTLWTTGSPLPCPLSYGGKNAPRRHAAWYDEAAGTGGAACWGHCD